MVQAKALKRALAEQLDDAIQASSLTKVDRAKRIYSSRSQCDWVLDRANLSVQLNTLLKPASALEKTAEIKLKRQPKDRLETALQEVSCPLTFIMNLCTFTS